MNALRTGPLANVPLTAAAYPPPTGTSPEVTMPNPVYEWQFADGTVFGLGTELEFRHWQREGINPADAKLGKLLGHEDASEDERRLVAWAA